MNDCLLDQGSFGFNRRSMLSCLVNSSIVKIPKMFNVLKQKGEKKDSILGLQKKLKQLRDLNAPRTHCQNDRLNAHDLKSLRYCNLQMAR